MGDLFGGPLFGDPIFNVGSPPPDLPPQPPAFGSPGTITLTSTKPNSSLDYMRYLFTEESGLVKTDRYMDSVTLDFALAPTDSDYVHLDRGSYIIVDSATYQHWFTGYITNEAEPAYLGKDSVTQLPVFGYKFQATADEYILSLKPIGVIAPFLNVTMGTILKTLVEHLMPTPVGGVSYFDVTNVQDGPIVAQYVVTPDRMFKDVFQDLCKQASFLFYGLDKRLYFRPQDDGGLGSIIIDQASPDYTPSRLSIHPSNTPILNDITVLGKLEPQTYMNEYYVGTGVTGTFPLTAGVYGADDCVLLQDTYSGSAIDTSIWQVYSGGLPVLNAPQDNFSVYDSYLQCTNATDTWIQSVSAIPIEGRVTFTHGEWDFLGLCVGQICTVWTQEPNEVLTGCLYGLNINSTVLSTVVSTVINPIVQGVVDTAQSVTVNSTSRFVIRTILECNKYVRQPFEYTYLDSSGVLQSVTSQQDQADLATWTTLITEVNPSNGQIVKQTTFQNGMLLDGIDDLYALYAPIVAIGATSSMDLTVGGTAISIPINCSLETATSVRIVNGSFDSWDSSTAPSGWINPLNVSQTTAPVGSGFACLFVDGQVQQDVSQLIKPGFWYNVIFRAFGVGTVTVWLSGTGMDSRSATFTIPSLYNFSDTLNNVFGPLTNAIDTIPTDLKLSIVVSGSVTIESFSLLSAWQRQMVGPNVMDSMDGLAPMATIVAGNANAQTKSTYTGAPQYNPGQDQLVFFKNSVTLQSTVPPVDQVFRVSYRAAGSAIGRVRSGVSVTNEQALWGDDGIRSIVRTDLDPQPRTSLECELAAGALVGENAFQHYEGTYTQFSWYFSLEPKAGMPITFANVTGIPFITAEEINQVVTTIESDHPVELFTHAVTFGKPDHVRWLLEKLKTPINSYQQTPATAYASPAYVDVADVGLNGVHPPDVTNVSLINWDDSFMYFAIGGEIPANGIELRYTDVGWGTYVIDPGSLEASLVNKNLIAIVDTTFFSVPRNNRGRTFFMRAKGAASITVTPGVPLGIATAPTSRYSTCISVRFPVKASNDFVRDWGCRLIDTASPLVTGTDLAQNRYTVVVPKEDYVDLATWRATLKTPGTAEINLLRSSDGGVTYVSLFPTGQNPVLSGATTTGSGFFVRFLQNGEILRYDCISADGTAGGLELVLQGRVYTSGDVPLNTQFFSGTLLPGGGALQSNVGSSGDISVTVGGVPTISGGGGAGGTGTGGGGTGGGPIPGSPVISAFDISPLYYVASVSNTLSWTVTGAATITIDNGVGDVTSVSSISVSPSGPTTYTLTATNLIATVTATVILDAQSTGLPTFPDASAYWGVEINATDAISTYLTNHPTYFTDDTLVTDMDVENVNFLNPSSVFAAQTSWNRARTLLTERGIELGTYISGTNVGPLANQNRYPHAMVLKEDMPSNAQYIGAWAGQTWRQFVNPADPTTMSAFHNNIHSEWSTYFPGIKWHFVDNSSSLQGGPYGAWSDQMQNVHAINMIAQGLGSRAFFNISMIVGTISDANLSLLISAVAGGGICLEAPWPSSISGNPTATAKAVTQYRRFLDAGIGVIMIGAGSSTPGQATTAALKAWVSTWRNSTDHLYLARAFFLAPASYYYFP